MENLDTAILLASQQGDLLSFVYGKLRSERPLANELYEALIRLHNSGEIDLINAFQELKNNSNNQIDFFSTRHVLEETLPKLRSPVLPVMRCVAHLVREAGQDLAAGLLLLPFTDFCSADASRPTDILNFTQESVDEYIDLLPPAIIGGARIDVQFYLDQATKFLKHSDIRLRRASVFAIGRIENISQKTLIDSALTCITECVETETDDPLLGNAIRSAFSLSKLDHSKEDWVISIIRTALPKGQDITLHIAAELISFEYDQVPDKLVRMLLSELLRINPANKGTVNKIDYAVAQMLEHNNWDIGVDFLENLLLRHHEVLSLADFDSTSHELFKNTDNRLNRLMTKWFMRGDRVLCDSIRVIVDLAHEHDLQLRVSTSEFDQSEPLQSIFLARKAIGYLFSKPVTAASIVISLLECVSDQTAFDELVNLLFDVLLLNYPGQLRDYFSKKADDVTNHVKKALEDSIGALDRYFDQLKAADAMPELYPSQTHREAHHRHFSRMMSKSMEEAQKDSIFSLLVSSSVILYGNKSIDYIYNADGSTNRMEIPMQSHGTTVEFPRTGNIDSFGLDYMLLVFRAEQLVKS